MEGRRDFNGLKGESPAPPRATAGVGESAWPSRRVAPAARRRAVAKVLYLLAVTVIVFVLPSTGATAIQRSAGLVALLTLQVGLLWLSGVGTLPVILPLRRLKWFFAFLIVLYALLPTEGGDAPDGDVTGRTNWLSLGVFGWTLWLNLAGLAHAGEMVLQIFTVVLAAQVVRLTGSGTDLATGLQALGLPTLLVYPLDLVLARIGGGRGGGGGGMGSGGGTRSATHSTAPDGPGFFRTLRQMLRGDATAFAHAIRNALDQAQADLQANADHRLSERQAHDAAVIAGIGLVMVGFKMLKLMPGMPIASGHKAALLIPLYVLASRLTYSRWGGTTAGAVMGIVGFMQGDGRFGPFEVLKHLAPGLVLDLLRPALDRLPLAWSVYGLLGLGAGVARLSTELAVLALLGTRAEAYLFVGVKLVPTLFAGFVGGLLAVPLLRVLLPPGGLVGLRAEPEPAAKPSPPTPAPAHTQSHHPEAM